MWKKGCAAFFALFCGLFLSAVTVSAADATITLSRSALEPRQSVTVTIAIDAAEALYVVEFDVTYDDEVLCFQNADCATNVTGGGTVRAVLTISGQKIISCSFPFLALKEGVSSVSISGMVSGEVVDIPFCADSPAGLPFLQGKGFFVFFSEDWKMNFLDKISCEKTGIMVH